LTPNGSRLSKTAILKDRRAFLASLAASRLAISTAFLAARLAASTAFLAASAAIFAAALVNLEFLRGGRGGVEKTAHGKIQNP
jgi:hypothetical protein